EDGVAGVLAVGAAERDREGDAAQRDDPRRGAGLHEHVVVAVDGDGGGLAERLLEGDAVDGGDGEGARALVVDRGGQHAQHAGRVAVAGGDHHRVRARGGERDVDGPHVGGGGRGGEGL